MSHCTLVVSHTPHYNLTLTWDNADQSFELIARLNLNYKNVKKKRNKTFGAFSAIISDIDALV